jgi:HTH-type transcriptional regulator/antitoxin HigA
LNYGLKEKRPAHFVSGSFCVNRRARAVSLAYTALLAKIPPRVIRSEEQNEGFIATLYELEQHNAEWTAEEAELADLLTLLIEDFEEKHYSLPKSSPLEVIHFLMDQHGLKQKDLVEVFGLGFRRRCSFSA